MIWTGWIPPASAAAQAAADAVAATVPPPPPPAKLLFNAKPVARPKLFEEWIDVDMVEKIIEEGNGQELKWLKDLIVVDGIRIRNVTGRYLKVDRFLNRIEKARKLGPDEEPEPIVTEADIEKENPTFVPS